MDPATLLCARLLRAGAVPRVELPDLDFPEVRREVERRLEMVGLVLATSAYSEHVGIRLAPGREATGDEVDTEATDGLAARVLEALERLGGTGGISDLEREIGAKRERLRPVLKKLIETGRIRRTGERRAVRYHLLESETEDGHGFFLLDEPFAHLSLDRVDQVGRFLRASRSQFLLTAPTTLDRAQLDPAGLVIALQKKRSYEPHAPVPIVAEA